MTPPKGRPPGSGEGYGNHCVNLTAEQWAWLQASGNASAKLREVLDKAMARKK